ncbi:hypothetical protein JJC03_09150 [Flavobacterium oreochromis]|uniref:hypothetical protein n=1 Tax=Flavobacterium oreochromis TaxID=2906078 RepID=UPI001CE58059|nr:hypothetical protein [Flavobacterium oreochromis]QYS85405.1 hypothetical protein JJC03_09150 [Flavobacterium oreochromis]
MNSTITITFNKSFTIDYTYFYFYIGTYGQSYPQNKSIGSYYWMNGASNMLPILPPTNIPGETEAIQLYNALQASNRSLTTTRVANIVTIELKDSNQYFAKYGSGAPNYNGSDLITAIINNYNPARLNLLNVNFKTDNSYKCKKVECEIITNKTVNLINGGINQANPIKLNLDRGSSSEYTLVSLPRKQISEMLRFSNIGDISCIIVSSPYRDYFYKGSSFLVLYSKTTENNKLFTIKDIHLTDNTEYILYIDKPVTSTYVNERVIIDYTDTVVLNINTPSVLDPNNYLISVVNNNNTYSAVVNSNTSTTGLALEYSLDNINYQVSNQFTQVPLGSNTLYVRDQFGCSFTKTFTVSEFGDNDPYFYLSKSNSIRFADRIAWGDSANYKKDENTLSYEVDVDSRFREVQQFQTADIITTQFKSNYKINNVFVNHSGLTTNLLVDKKSNNLNITDIRDSSVLSVNGKLAIYFKSGNVYDSSNNVISKYTLNGDLPEWGDIGNIFSINSVSYTIQELHYDDKLDSYILITNNSYSDIERIEKVKCTYNRLPYEVYEFTIDMSNYIDETITVSIEASMSNLHPLKLLSEDIDVRVRHADTVEIKYYNDTNTDIDYSTGIIHKIRIPLTKKSGKVDGDSETQRTDSSVYMLKSNLYEVDEFKFEPVTKEIWRKVMIALSHENVFIDEVGYVKNSDFNTEGPLENSNLYVLTASMIKTGSAYNSKTTGNVGYNGSVSAIPGIIEYDNGYILY